jgi:hypothetical protein
MALRGEFGGYRGMGVFKDNLIVLVGHISLTLNTASLTLNIYLR